MRSVPSPVAESPWVLLANGERIASGTASPGMERELAAGLLVADGFLTSLDDLHSIDVRHLSRATTRLDARVDAARYSAVTEERRHRTETGCGMLHFVVCEPHALMRVRPDAMPERSDQADMLRQLFDRCTRERPGGGVHAAGLIGGGVAHVAVDVGRHCAVNKAIGAAFLADAALPELGLVLTSRISGMIVLSAARAGVAWVVSRSVPTTLAVDLASAAGLTLVARAAGHDRHVFSPSVPGSTV